MISGPELPAKSGTTKQLVIILHGWGADGVNLIDLARPWAAVLPDAHFCAPNAPHPCEANPFGFQWFSLNDRSPFAMAKGVAGASGDVNAFIDAKVAELSNCHPASAQPRAGSDTGKIDSARSQCDQPNDIKLALVGFSQGTMTALHVGIRRPDVACILGYSGALLDSKEMIENALNERQNQPGAETSFPAVCLIHGEQDDVVPFAAMKQAEQTLTACQISVTTHPRPNLPHSIDMEGVEIGGRFLIGSLK